MSDNRKSVLDGARVQILGLQAFQNHLLAEWLCNYTGADCQVVDDEGYRKLREDHAPLPQVVLLDAQVDWVDRVLSDLQEADGEEDAPRFTAMFNLTPDADVSPFLQRGVKGVFFKHDSPELMLKGLEAMWRGELWYSRDSMSRYIINHKGEVPTTESAEHNLTGREVEILSMIARGLANETIAKDLCISPHTVKTHVYNIFRKIGVPNRVQAAMWAKRHLVDS